MSASAKPVSGLWVGGLEFIIFILFLGAAGVPYYDRLNNDDFMAATIGMGGVGLILVLVLNVMLNKRAAQRTDLAVAQQSILVVRDRNVATILLAGAAPLGMTLGLVIRAASTGRGDVPEQLLSALGIALAIIIISAAIASRFWGC